MRIISPQGTIEYSGGIDSIKSMRAGDACENCAAATCKYSMINLGVTRCSVETVNESLLLDRKSSCDMLTEWSIGYPSIETSGASVVSVFVIGALACRPGVT